MRALQVTLLIGIRELIDEMRPDGLSQRFAYSAAPMKQGQVPLVYITNVLFPLILGLIILQTDE